MRRGFKSEAERLAERVRSELNLRPTAPIDIAVLAHHVGADVRRADELTSLAKLEALDELQPGAFSACTFTIGNRHVIVHSPLASVGRTNSDIAHEIAHILLEHNLATMQTLGRVSFFTCNPDEEQEANWLAGCLLLPRTLVYRAARNGLDAAAIAMRFGVSEQMAGYRLRTTGVLRQLGAGPRS